MNFNFTAVYSPAKLMAIVDCLSLTPAFFTNTYCLIDCCQTNLIDENYTCDKFEIEHGEDFKEMLTAVK